MWSTIPLLPVLIASFFANGGAAYSSNGTRGVGANVIANSQAGASVVSFMTRMPAATYGDTATASGSVIKTQYRVTVTSPWGVVSYLPAGI